MKMTHNSRSSLHQDLLTQIEIANLIKSNKTSNNENYTVVLIFKNKTYSSLLKLDTVVRRAITTAMKAEKTPGIPCRL